MGVVISQLCIDSADPVVLGRWWAETLGWAIEDDDPEEVWVAPDGDAQRGILFLRVPEGKTVKNRLHLDLRPENGSDQATELDRLVVLGATRVDVGQGAVPWIVLADPEGNEFCLLRGTPAESAAAG
ncbi:VOC family protein [Cellulomonas sp. KRMCY2]|uniref:VOC family protein n=1 Tax=Cellulomonas sp. KRMCY2 TaxID=1304865 RepID=UPI00045EA1CE|nr:VOC family protein [Cellulomonas sp. KRMCY2]